MKHLPFFLGVAALVACSSRAPSGAVESASEDLFQGTDDSLLWHTHTLFYCFDEPLLPKMPAAVKAAYATQAALHERFMSRAREFIWGIDNTWQAVGLIDFVPRFECQPGDLHVNYDTDEGLTRGGQADYGTKSVIMMNAQNLVPGLWPDGVPGYHSYTAAHEMGHALGFRHEQDRPDSTCDDSVTSDHLDKTKILTAYDPDSIMNYCNKQETRLTALDVVGFKRAYSFLGTVATTCADSNQLCATWAANGECTRNPSWMLAGCCASCGSSDPCRDQNAECSAWAKDDQCRVNPGYMHGSCCASCSAGR